MVRRSVKRFLTSPVVDSAIRLVVVASIVVSSLAWLQTHELARCVADYNNANNARSVALTDAAENERDAERTADNAQAALFVSPILNKPADQRTPAEKAEVVRLFRAYQLALTEQSKERASADGARRDHPIPPPPSAVCD